MNKKILIFGMILGVMSPQLTRADNCWQNVPRTRSSSSYLGPTSATNCKESVTWYYNNGGSWDYMLIDCVSCNSGYYLTPQTLPASKNICSDSRTQYMTCTSSKPSALNIHGEIDLFPYEINYNLKLWWSGTTSGYVIGEYEYNCSANASMMSGYSYPLKEAKGCCIKNGICDSSGTLLYCKAGYYKSDYMCSQCPTWNGQRGTSLSGASDITKCYMPAGTKFSDSTGTWEYTDKCYYTK